MAVEVQAEQMPGSGRGMGAWRTHGLWTRCLEQREWSAWSSLSTANWHLPLALANYLYKDSIMSCCSR